MTLPSRRAGWPLAAFVFLAIGVAGCSSSSTNPSVSTTPRLTPTSPPAAATARALEHALLAKKVSPRPTAATCRPATAAEVAHGPFGPSTHPQFTCRLVVGGSPASYDVQIQGNGCYVAERHRQGQAIYGCGARVRG